MQHIIDILDYHGGGPGADLSPAVFRALQKARSVGSPILTLPKGTYHFWPDRAYERHCFISNNDQGLKRIAFPLIGMDDVTVEGNGSEFIFHGRIVPFVVDNSQDVTIRNLSIDYERPFFTQGLVVGSSAGHVNLEISKDLFPYRMTGKGMVFHGDNWESEDDLLVLMTEFDPGTKAPARNGAVVLAKLADSVAGSSDGFFDSIATRLTFSELGDGLVRASGNLGRTIEPGNILAFNHERRNCPGIFINRCTNVAIESVDIHHAGAMGLIAQLSKDISVKRLTVALKEGTRRIITTNADATHFVNCTGTIALEECVFENMLDDGVNVHGIYTTVSRPVSPDTIEVELMHFQQQGIELYAPGDMVHFINRRTLQPYRSAMVKGATMVNRRYIHVTFEEAVTHEVSVGDAVENRTAMPDLVIRGCRMGRNRPRGILATTPGQILIEGNVFYNSQFAINITGDANYWFESGAVRDVTIRDNTFLDCCYLCPGQHIITINPEVPEESLDGECFHRNISITGNLFKAHDKCLLYAHSVDGLNFTGNGYEQAGTYAPAPQIVNPIELKACRNTVCEMPASARHGPCQ